MTLNALIEHLYFSLWQTHTYMYTHTRVHYCKHTHRSTFSLKNTHSHTHTSIISDSAMKFPFMNTFNSFKGKMRLGKKNFPLQIYLFNAKKSLKN